MKRVDRKQISFREDGLYYEEGLPFSGVAITTYPDGSLRSESEFKDGLVHGRAREWYKNGNLASDTDFFRDVQHGVAREWDECGNLEEESNAEFGVVIYHRKWEDGELVESYDIDKNGTDYQLLEQFRVACGKK